MDADEGNRISHREGSEGKQGKEVVASQRWQAPLFLNAWWRLGLAQSTMRSICGFFWGL